MATKYELPDELWDIVKSYQLNWKKTHSKSLSKVVFELDYLYVWHCGDKFPGVCYFQNSYFDRIYGGWDISQKDRLEHIEKMMYR